ncbi:MAG: ATP synthase F1 subunit gamma [Phycisphaerae bacterium]|nr:ATP synthase F1 subunit gamma [Phycisphaerae bacterium]
MGKSREIKGRIRAVKNIQRITRTMQMIATSKFAKAQQAAVSSKPYTEGLFDLVAQLASGDEIDHPLLRPATASGEPKEITLVLTSERGLAGPYNANIIRLALRHLREHPAARRGPVQLVGKKGLAALTFAGIDIAKKHDQFGDKPSYEDVERLGQSYIDAFTAGEVSAVRVIYMKYISAGRQTPTVLQLLPFEKPEALEEAADKGASAPYEFTPSAEELLDTLLPAAVKATLFQCFNDAIVSEHVARMVAMKAATDNAGKMGKALKRRYNRARQAQITTELTEIISGAAALE